MKTEPNYTNRSNNCSDYFPFFFFLLPRPNYFHLLEVLFIPVSLHPGTGNAFLIKLDSNLILSFHAFSSQINRKFLLPLVM
jgi:hypothetical protein